MVNINSATTTSERMAKLVDSAVAKCSPEVAGVSTMVDHEAEENMDEPNQLTKYGEENFANKGTPMTK